MTTAAPASQSRPTKAVLWRMDTGDHLCPYGLKARDLLKRKGFQVEDHKLNSRAETDAFKEKHKLKTTPQVWIGGKRVGGYDDLRDYFDLKAVEEKGSPYSPIIAIFSVSLLTTLAIQLHWGSVFSWLTVLYFTAFSMIILAIQKLQDVESFTMQFITYDLLAMRQVRYGYVYPFAEAYVGIGMLSGLSPWLFAPLGVFIGSIGAISVVKAVYIDKRELKCACVGGNSNVPLGFVSLTENLFMLGAGLAMLVF